MTKELDMRTEGAEPTTVGEMLSEEFLKPLKMSVYELANRMGISYNRTMDILKNKSIIKESESLALSNILNTDAYFWLNLQEHHKNWSDFQTMHLRKKNL